MANAFMYWLYQLLLNYFFAAFRLSLNLKFSLKITVLHSYFEGNYIFRKLFLNSRAQNTYLFEHWLKKSILEICQ